jgi:hypothetical protein
MNHSNAAISQSERYIIVVLAACYRCCRYTAKRMRCIDLTLQFVKQITAFIVAVDGVPRYQPRNDHA